MERPEQLDQLVRDIEPTVRAIVRRKLGVQFDRSDLADTQDALDIVNHVLADVAARYKKGRVRPESWEDYAAVATYHASAEYLRRKRAPRYRLQLKIRYFLSHRREFAVWSAAGPGYTCGLALWRSSDRPAPDSRIAAVRRDPKAAVPSLSSVTVAEHIKPDDLVRPLLALFEYLGGPVSLNDVYAAIASVALPTDTTTPNPDPTSPSPWPDEELRTNELYRTLWRGILNLRPHWRRAFLLNPPRGFEIEQLPFRRVATIAQIGETLDLTAAEFDRLVNAVTPTQSSSARMTPETAAERLAHLWPHLPLKDDVVALLFDETPQHVINLRRLAKDELRARLAAAQTAVAPRGATATH